MTRMMKKNLPGSIVTHTPATFELQLRTLELLSSVPALTFELSDDPIQIIDTCYFQPILQGPHKGFHFKSVQSKRTVINSFKIKENKKI